jgi:hypothetical protein
MRTTATRLRPIYIRPGRYMPRCRSMQRLWCRCPRLATHLDMAAAIGVGTDTDMGGARHLNGRHEKPSRLDSLSKNFYLLAHVVA